MYLKDQQQQDPLYVKWERLLRLSWITGSGEGVSEKRRQLNVKSNTIFAVSLCFSAFRLGYTSYLVSNEQHHLIGNTFANIGNIALLGFAGVGTAYTQWSLFRVVTTWQAATGRLSVLQTLSSLLSEQDEGLRRKKRRLAAFIYTLAVMGTGQFALFAHLYHGFLLYLNINHSKDTSEMHWWCFWFLLDMVSCYSCTMTMSFVPACFILQVLDYRLDLSHMISEVRRLLQEDHMDQEHESVWSRHIHDMIQKLHWLSKKARHVNTCWSPFLFVTVVCATPNATIFLFITLYAGEMMVAATYACVGVIQTAFAFTMQAVAGDITAQSETLYQELAMIAAEARDALSLSDRRLLLLLMEESLSECEPLAMHHVTGEKYTMIEFGAYVMETAVQFTLLLTFSNYLIRS